MIDLAHPGLVVAAGGLAAAVLRGHARAAVIVLAPLAALAALWRLPEGIAWQAAFMGYDLAPLAVDRLSRLFATVFLLMAFGGGLYALDQPSRLEVPAAFVYAGAAVGVTLAGDLVTVFACWGIMPIGSTLVL